ncbi:MAG: hypothetical protein M1819_001770 [Sarea resinae]|nr:MAG: hypothetical protein M1819_001770 [Sarea resinae]
MLDESLPTFFLKSAPDGVKHHTCLYLTQYGSEPAPAYTLQHADPASPAAKNCYAAAIFDSFNPDVLFAEVLVRPEWTQPSLSQEEIRKNDGVPPPPQPILPTEFTIQLYNPDQQVLITQKAGSWGGSPQWEFEMPQQTFRLPSASTLDRSLSDPAASSTTPKIKFLWKKEGKLSKDLTCSLSGKSTSPDGSSKRKNREPDIVVALFSSLKEITIYEPNLYRVDMEDPKGLEVVLLLGAAVIRDIYFGQMKEVFHIAEPPQRIAEGARKPSLNSKISSSLLAAPSRIKSPKPSPQQSQPRHDPHRPTANPPVNGHSQPAAGGVPPPHTRNPLRHTSHPQPGSSHQAVDPRTQWEIDAETARLKKQVEAEERERRRKEESRQRERRRLEEAETDRLKKMVKAEEEERRRRQKEADKETERLRKLYGVPPPKHRASESRPPQPPPRNAHSAPLTQAPWAHPPPTTQPQQRPHVHFPVQPPRQQSQPQPQRFSGSPSPYLQAPSTNGAPHASSSGFFSKNSSGGKRHSIFNLRSHHNDGSGASSSSSRLSKKQSSMF